MRQEKPGLGLVALVFALLLLALCQSSVEGAEWYATFEYSGVTYAVSEEQEGHWEDSVTYCADMGDGWRLPTLNEALAMRDSYEGGNPLSVTMPEICQGYEHRNLPQLWTGTECDECGYCAPDKGAYVIHRKGLRIYTDFPARNYIYCQSDDGEDGHYCCVLKSRYGVIHICPVARCVKAISGEPEPTPTPFRLWLPVLHRLRSQQ